MRGGASLLKNIREAEAKIHVANLTLGNKNIFTEELQAKTRGQCARDMVTRLIDKMHELVFDLPEI